MGEFVMILPSAAVSAGLARPFKGDDAGGVGEKSEVAELEHDIDPHGTVVSIAGLAVELHAGGIDLRLWHVHPRDLTLHAQLGLADGGEILAELALVGLAELALERFGFAEDIVEDTALFGVTAKCGVARAGIIGHKEALEQPLRAVFCGERSAVAIEGKRVTVPRRARPGAIGNLQRWEPGLRADFFRDELIGGNRVGVILARHGTEVRAGEPCIRAGVTAGGIRVAEPRKDGEAGAMLLQRGKCGRKFVGSTLRGGHPLEDVDAVWHVAKNHTRHRLCADFASGL